MSRAAEVQAWLANCLPEVKLSKPEIDSLLLRGPFKDILLQFLVPKCRSAEEIDVIRSNLYVYGLRSTEPPPPCGSSTPTPMLSKAAKKNKELTSFLADLEKRKIMEMEKLAKTAALLNMDNSGPGRSKRNLEGIVFSKRKELQEFHDVISATEGLSTDLSSLVERDNVVVPEQEVKSEKNVNQLQEEAVTLFRSTFFETAPPNMLEEMNQKLEYLFDMIVKGGNVDGNNKNAGRTHLTQKQLVLWQKCQIQKGRDTLNQLRGMAQANYMQEIHNEMQKLELDLCKQHIHWHKVNEELKSRANSVKKARQDQLLAWTNEGISCGMNRTYLLKLLREEQLKAEINRCREIRESSNKDKESTLRNGHSFGPDASFSNSFKNFEEVENLVSCLLKTYPETKSKLLSITPNAGRYTEFVAALKQDFSD